MATPALKFYCAGGKVCAFLGPPVIALTDEQQDAILNVARPLDREERVLFMAALAELIAARRSSPGEGELMRVLRDLQARYFHPPPDDYLEGRPIGWRASTARG